MRVEIRKALEDSAADPAVRVVILTGAGRAFCAGADIKEICEIRSPMEAHLFVTSVQRVFNKIERLDKPVIAAVSGLALGGGCELALACDLRIAAENATFGQPEIKIGVIPGAGGTQRLPRLVGLGRAKELLFTGDTIDAQEAYRIGLINKVVPVEALMSETKKMALKLTKQPPLALKTTKTVVNEGINMNIQSALALEARGFEILFSTEDQKEGMKAFVEKRKPIFKGK
jgi:enoyl-CoA hydratase